MSNRIEQLYSEQGQSAWLDNLKRDYITSGKLVEVRESGVRGLTSNPSIFQKAIQGSADYDKQFNEIAADTGDIVDDYWSLVIRDIHGACDVFSKMYDHSNGVDGYVSVEVAPSLAHDESGTETAARHLHERINRRNLMVKIPGTAEGLGPIQQMISEGRSINVTLIFSIPRYADVMEAYITGLEQFATDPGADLSQVASVASFFISRVDVEVDKRLNANGSDEALALRGKAAVAQGKLAYKLFTETFSGPRWEALVARGARVQRPLWASTSTKNPDYPDTLYVDELIGPDTVNTLPDATLEAFADHGTVARRIDADVDKAEAVWAALPGVGVDMDEVADQLEREGVASFITAFDELIEALEAKAAELRS
ncbi:transaldolase [Ilumatobacter sp.]|uniref:transaldolase n=1 Tax=Ilumatobacter sp. TaxID=1967498 RepID=UPI003750EFD2